MDKQKEVFENTKALLLEKGFIVDQSNKSFIRFSTKSLDNIVGFIGEGWTNSKRLLLFEIENRKNRYGLKLLIGPGPEEIRNKLHYIAATNANIYNKGNVRLTSTWTTIYSNKFLVDNEIDRLSIAQIMNTINRKLDKFIEQDLDMLCKVFQKEILTQGICGREWLIPCNPEYYDVIGAFKKFTIIDWKQSNNIKLGDIVYIYVSKPYQQIKYKCITRAVDLKEASRKDSEFILEGREYVDYGRYMRLELLDEYTDGLFTRRELKENGVISVQGPRTIPETLKLFMTKTLEKNNFKFSSYRTTIDDELIKELQKFQLEMDAIPFKGETEKEVLAKVRIGHGALKKYILMKENSCRVCGLQDERFLIASHIKPWSISDEQERLDENNILLLCPHHDAVFDKGYITFDEEGRILISSELTLETRALLNLIEGKEIQVREKNKKYIEWHRKNIFRP